MATEKIDIPLYDNEVTITFYPNSHRYKVSGETILSVSKIVDIINKPYLIHWATKLTAEYLKSLPIDQRDDFEVDRAKNMHQEKKAEATYVGTLVHDYVEAYSKGLDPEIPEDENARNGILAFLKWKTDHNVEFILQEKLVYSLKHKYVGKFDAIIKVDGKVYLADYKTSKKFQPLEMGMQTAGYMQALQEETGMLVDGRMILRFDKETGEFEVHELIDYEGDVEAFNCALVLAKRQKLLDKYYK